MDDRSARPHRVPSISFEITKHRPSDVLYAIRNFENWRQLPRPNRSSIVRAQELALASGAPVKSPEPGARKVIVMPSIKGGLILVFVLDSNRSYTAVELNNRTTYWISGRDWTRGAERVSHSDAVLRVAGLRAL